MNFHVDEFHVTTLERMRCCVDEAKVLIEQQSELVARLERSGRSTTEARKLLRNLMVTLQLFRESLRELEPPESRAEDAERWKP